jgi:hypothetical protein
MITTEEAMRLVFDALAGYVFLVRDEAELQDQVSIALTERIQGALDDCGVSFEREVAVHGGRFDILVHVRVAPDVARRINVVLELKLGGSAAAVERQVQRYATMQDVDAVIVVTTSAQLARKLTVPLGNQRDSTIGGKPFRVIALRTS